MSALLSVLQVPSFRSALLSETGGAINHSSRFSRLAEQLGAAIRVGHPDAVDPDCLRNAANSFFYKNPQDLPPGAPASQLSSEPHSFSRVFTGAFLDVLAGIFRLQGATPSSDGLEEASLDTAKLLVAAILAAPVVPDYFSQVAAHMVEAGEATPFNGKYRDVLKSSFVRRGILSLQAAATLGAVPKASARTMSMASDSARRSSNLALAAIPASSFGLKAAVLNVHTASEPKRLGVTGSSPQLGPEQATAVLSAAESYTEDLFQRGHVDVRKHAHPTAGLIHPYTFKTHLVEEQGGELLLKRISFDCGFHFAFDQAF